MPTSCIDKINCENAWDCTVIVTDIEGNPIDISLLNNGDSVICEIFDREGYVFSNWVDEDGEYVNSTSLGGNKYRIDNINCSKTYYAKYCAIEYTITVQTEGFVGNQNPYLIPNINYGDSIKIVAPVNNKCRFLYWTKDNVIVSESVSFDYVITENCRFVAHYEIAQYRITAKPNDRNMGTTIVTNADSEEQNIFEYGSVANLSAVSSNGYTFFRWNDGNTSANRTITVTGSKTYIAYFRPN